MKKYLLFAVTAALVASLFAACKAHIRQQHSENVLCTAKREDGFLPETDFWVIIFHKYFRENLAPGIPALRGQDDGKQPGHF